MDSEVLLAESGENDIYCPCVDCPHLDTVMQSGCPSIFRFEAHQFHFSYAPFVPITPAGRRDVLVDFKMLQQTTAGKYETPYCKLRTKAFEK